MVSSSRLGFRSRLALTHRTSHREIRRSHRLRPAFLAITFPSILTEIEARWLIESSYGVDRRGYSMFQGRSKVPEPALACIDRQAGCHHKSDFGSLAEVKSVTCTFNRNWRQSAPCILFRYSTGIAISAE